MINKSINNAFHLFDYTGVPPLLSRRVLETLTYLARNHLYVAKNLLQSRLSHPEIREPNNASDARGKAVMVVEDEVNIDESNGGYISIAMLLGLLNQPLYLRSIAHLEQVMIWLVLFAYMLFNLMCLHNADMIYLVLVLVFSAAKFTRCNH
jgi:hypothetical protein